MTGNSFAMFDTAIGACGIVWGARGINGVQLPMGVEEKTRSRIVQRYGDIAEATPPAHVQHAIEGMVELLEGKPNDLKDIVLDLEGVPEFNRGVYDIARTIPPGKTMTYGDIARRPGARAQPVSDRGAVSSRARRGRQTRRLFRQWRRGDKIEDARDRRCGGQSHTEPVRLRCSPSPRACGERVGVRGCFYEQVSPQAGRGKGQPAS